MIQKALQYLVGLKENKVYSLDGHTYSDNPLTEIKPTRYYPAQVSVGSLDGIVKLVRAEYGEIGELTTLPAAPLFIRINGPTCVDVFTRPDNRGKRINAYEATCDDVNFKEGWRNQQEAIIQLRSRFIPTDDSEYLLNLISRINNDQGVQSSDNGVSQTVVARQGVSLMSSEAVKPRLTLQPFRTFREVPQPESEFILRLDEKGCVGLFEADGGIWKMEAKDNIRQYLEAALADEISCGKVIVMV